MTVWVVPGANKGRGTFRYHTDRDCPRVRDSERLRPKELDQLPDHAEECGTCSGVGVGRADNPDPFGTRDELESLNPEDVGLSPIGSREGVR